MELRQELGESGAGAGSGGALAAVGGEMTGDITNTTQDEVRLLRLRTRKQEIVIVPDSKYLLIVVHDTPPA